MGGASGAKDLAGNPLASDVRWTFTTAADTTPPTISAVTAMSGSNAAVIAWTTDEPSISRVDYGTSAQALPLNAVNPSLVTAHTVVLSGLSMGKTYYFRVTSADAASNVAVSPTSENPPSSFVTSIPAGLVAAFGFNEGGGGTVNDVSGMGNKGTISGATWVTAGRYGNALSFDGVSNWITVDDSPSLMLKAGMTLEAWVRPTSLTGWRPVLYKESPFSAGVPIAAPGLSWALYASDLTAPPSVYATSSTGADQWVHAMGPSLLSVNTWTHLAGTYDGTALRLYVNGVLVRTRAHAGAIFSTTGPLRIGGSSVITPWGSQYFKGQIDELRIYNRTLSQGEIQVDMNTALP